MIHAFAKANGIFTHRAPHIPEAPWFAIYLGPDEKRDPWDVIASEIELYDETGRTAEGSSESDAILKLCRQCKIDCSL